MARVRELTTDIVAAYVKGNRIPAGDLPALIRSVGTSVAQLAESAVLAEKPLTPAVNPENSVHRDYIVCLEDGRSFKSMKRHLAAEHGLTPEAYRTRWGLAPDYPVAAPGYSEQRSAMAKSLGLGRNRSTKAKRRRKAA